MLTIVANLPGITRVSTDIDLQPSQTLTADIHLQLSAVQDQVIVTASLGGALAPETAVGSSAREFASTTFGGRGAGG